MVECLWCLGKRRCGGDQTMLCPPAAPSFSSFCNIMTPLGYMSLRSLSFVMTLG